MEKRCGTGNVEGGGANERYHSIWCIIHHKDSQRVHKTQGKNEVNF